MENTNRKKLIVEYLGKEENKDLSSWALAKKILQENGKKFTEADFNSLRQAVDRYMKKGATEEVVSIAAHKEQPKYQVIGGHYQWTAKNGLINLPVEFIDQLFYEYSDHGLNLSQTEIINKHNLEVWQWNTIKSTLWLYKKANIFSPYTVQNTDPDKLGEMVSEKISKMINNTGYQVEQQYKKELNKKYKQVIESQTRQDVIIQAMFTELYDLLPACEILPAIRVNEDSNGVYNVFIFDLHYGAESRPNVKPEYSPAIVKEMMLQVVSCVNQLNAKEVNFFFGGDMIESFTGLNHLDSWKGIARGYYGAKVIIELYKMLIEVLSTVNNLNGIYAVAGNHDRATEKRDADGEGWMAEILFELVRLAYRDTSIFVKYDPKLISESIDGIQYIMSHGHLKLSDKNPAELILEHGDPYKFNLLVSGHWHERKVKKDHKDFRQIVCPPIFNGNDYSVNLGYNTASGFLVATNNNYNNKPKIIDIAL